MRVLAAMSGGVDSAVAAARAAAAGHDVTGVHLALSRNPQTYRSGARGCCTLEDARDARRAADVIGIPFYVWDMAEQFHANVVDDFVAEYAAGRTPNPCLRCNEKIKFAAVLDRAVALGFDAVVTGHHARLGADGLLRRSVDLGKDQSYVLAVLTRAQLDRSIFPLGDSTKAQVRAEAAARGLAVADKPDSHDICFIADGDTQAFLDRRLGETPGNIVDGATGAVLGHHAGAHGYTIGQRKGLRLDRPAADGRPRYVLSITPVTEHCHGRSRRSARRHRDHRRAPGVDGHAPAGRAGARGRADARPRRNDVRARCGRAGRNAGDHVGFAGTGDRPRPGHRGLSTRPGRRCRARIGHDRPGGSPVRGHAVTERFAWSPGSATGIGSLPGTDIAEAVKTVLGELPDLPYLPELPARGPGADMIGRSAGLLVEMPVELYASRWRIASHAGRDLRRTRDLWDRDIDALTEAAAGLDGAVKLQVAGPWTLAASIDLPIGGRLLRDPGAVRDLTASLAEGLARHVADVRARLPYARVLVQIDEPSLPAVLAGHVPTESGYGTLRAVDASLARSALADVVAAAGVPAVAALLRRGRAARPVPRRRGRRRVRGP